MGSEASDINNLDRLRSQLEENVAKLRKTLQVWQTWEAEFEGLKEEILTLPDEKPSRDDLVGSEEVFLSYFQLLENLRWFVGSGGACQRLL